jgi:hypothetical protein
LKISISKRVFLHNANRIIKVENTQGRNNRSEPELRGEHYNR